VLIGKYEGEVAQNPDEIAECRWTPLSSLKEDIDKNPDKYTPWFRMEIEELLGFYRKYIDKLINKI